MEEFDRRAFFVRAYGALKRERCRPSDWFGSDAGLCEMSWVLQPAYANPCCTMRHRSGSRHVVRCSAAPAKLEVRVLVSSDGRLVCPDLPAGVYTVSSWWAGQGVRNEQALSSAPGCDVSRSRDCGVFCTLNEAGDLVRSFF